MKIAIELDLSPQEARELLGMPDITEAQRNWTKAVEDQIMTEVKNLSPEAIMQSWMKGAGANVEWLTNLMSIPGLPSSKS